MTLKRLPMAEKDSKNNRWKCSPRVTPSGFICIYFCICLGSFFFCFSNKTVPDFHDSQNSFRVFVENMNKMLLQTCWNTTVEALRVRGRLWTPSRPLSGFDKVLRARWRGSGLSIFGFEEKKQKKRRQARSCFWGSIFYFFLMPHITAHTHTRILHPTWDCTYRTASLRFLFEIAKSKSWDPQIMFPSTSGCLRRCSSSQVGTGGCLFAGSVIIFRNLARTDDDDDDDGGGVGWGEGGVCADQKPRGCLSLSYLSLLLTAITGLHPQL